MAQPPNRLGGLIQRLDKYPDHLQAIGLVITEFGRLEQSLALVLWELIGDADRGDAVFYSLASSKARCDVIRGVANEVLEPKSALKKEILDIVEKARGVAEKRNDLAHGVWGEPSQKKENPFCQIKRPASKNMVFSRHWSVKDLNQLADKIGAVELRASKIALILRAGHCEATRASIEWQAQQDERVRAYVDKFR